MTRINAGVPPRELHRLHLIAEYRELPRVPKVLVRALRTATREDVLARVPAAFTLGTGHVRFFYDKLLYLQKRYDSLMSEMYRRGYKVDASRVAALFDNADTAFYKDWKPTRHAAALVRERITLRISEKPHVYR